MTKRLISFLIALCIFIAIPLSARYKYNPFTRKLDYYEPVSGSDLGDLGDVTLTGLATGNVLYYNGTAWVNLATGANTNVLTLAGGVPTWAVAGAPAAHAASHEVGGADLVDHDQLTNYLAAQHLTLPNTIVAVLTDHNLAAHTALGLYDAPGDVDHDLTFNYVANQHIDHTAITFSAAGLITGGGTLAANRTFTLTEATIEAAIDSLPNLTQMQTPWTKVFVVDAGGGGDYTTIQAALTAQNAGGETFLVAPGTYAGDTIHFSASNQVVKAVGHVANVIVTQADANIVDVGAWTDCILKDIEVRLTAPTTAINAIQAGTGTLRVVECRAYLATAVALVQADQPSLVGFTGAGTIVIKRGNYQYYHTGNTGGGGIKAAFRANQNLAEFHLHKLDVLIITNSGTALVTSIASSTGTAITQMHNCIDIVVTDPNATNVIGLGYHGGAGAHNIQGNHVHVVATANTSYGIYHGGTGTIRSSFNALHAQDTGGASYALFVGAGATLNSHFDDLRSDNGNSVVGTLNQVNSPADGDLIMSDELDVTGVSEFSGDTYQYEDIFVDWDDATDHMFISQSSESGTEDQALIRISDNRQGATVDETSEATLRIESEGYGFVNIGHSYFEGDFGVNGDATFEQDMLWTWDHTSDHASITQTDTTGTDQQPLILIDDDRTGAYANELAEATIFLDSAGTYALNVAAGQAYFQDDTTQIEDVFITWADAADHMRIIQGNAAGIEAQALIYINDDRTGTTANEPDEATLHIATEGPNSWAIYVADSKVQWDADVLWSWGSAADNASITQTAVAGIENVPLINIDDDRTGTTANELGEATIVIDADGYAGLFVQDGVSGFAQVLIYATSGIEMDNVVWSVGAGQDWVSMWDSNGVADDLITLKIVAGGANTTAMWYSTMAVNPSAMTDHDDYLSPTFVMVNDEGADASDYSGVVIGERAQANVKALHYFDFYAMTGDYLGGAAPGDELAATFRFGDAGTGVPDYATGPGNVLFEDDVEFDDIVTHDALFGFGTVVDLTIDAGGDVTVTKSYHKITVNGGTGSGADDLDTIAGGSEGQIIVIRPATSGVNDTVTVKDDVDNLKLNGDFVMDHVNDCMTLLFMDASWIEMSRSDNE